MLPKNGPYKFFKEILRLKNLVNVTTGQEGVWPFGYAYECNPSYCFKRPDGLWQKNEKINTHLPHGGSTVIFLWRLEPNYCCAGRPVYTADRVHQFLTNSETEKVILTIGDYTFSWKWDTVKMPTATCWGMKMGYPYYELRKGTSVLIQTEVKADFVRKYLKL
jgi:hypothetical protein